MLKFFNANQKNFSKKLEVFLSSRKFSQQNKSISVKKIISEVKKNGDAALIKYERKFSNIKIKSKKIKFYLLKKKKSQLSLDYKNSKKKTYSNKILVLPGTHDAKKIYDEINNKNIDNKSKVIFYIKFHPKKVIYAKDAEKLKVIKTIKNKMFSNVLISSTSTLVYDFLNMKKRFMVYNFDNKQNLISSNLKKKIRFYNFEYIQIYSWKIKN